MHYRLVFLLLLCSCFQSAFAQSTYHPTRSTLHQSIPGTKLSLVPPAGFEAATDFKGFKQDASSASIMALDLPASFSAVTEGFTAEGMASRGVIVDTMIGFRLNDLPGVLVLGQQQAMGQDFRKIIFTFGNNQETILINGAFLLPNDTLEEAMLAALQSTVYDAAAKLDPFADLDYTISLEDSPLQLSGKVSGALMIGYEAKLPPTGEDKTMLIITKSFSKIPIPDQAAFMKKRLNQFPLQLTESGEPNPFELAGLTGYKIQAKSKDEKTGDVEEVDLVILFSDELYYIFLGTTNMKYAENMAEIRKVVETFRLK